MDIQNQKQIDDLFSHYINQFYKMLNLFEAKDKNGFKVGIRVLSELEQLPYQIPTLSYDFRFVQVLIKTDVIIEELFYLDGNQQFVKNHCMESMNLLGDIKEGLK